MLVFLFLITAVIGYLAYLNIKEHQVLNEAFITEKKNLEKELNHLISDYDKLIKMEIDLKKDFNEKREFVFLLKDSLKKTPKNDYNYLNKIKNKAIKLEEENSFIFLAVEYLNKTNNILLYGNHLSH